MEHQHHDDEGLERVIARLRSARPVLTPEDLDRVKRRTVARTARLERRERLMRKRLVLTTMLVAGLLMSSAGATLAIDGVSSRQDASVAQYGVTTTPTTTPAVTGAAPTPTTPAVTGAATTPTPAVTQAVGGEEAPTLEAVTTPTAPTAVQPARQLEEAGELPFTGYAGFTILLIGLALLAGGFVLRRGTRREMADL